MKRRNLFLGFVVLAILCFPFSAYANNFSPLPSFAIASPDFSSSEEVSQLIWETIEENYAEYFLPIRIDFSESRVIVYVEKKGLASELKCAYEQGYDEQYEPWVQYKQNFLHAYNSLSDVFVNNGRDDLAFELWLINDDFYAERRSPFAKYLAYASSCDCVCDVAMIRYDSPMQNLSEIPVEIVPLHRYFTEQLEKLGFDFVSVFYNENRKQFVIEVSILNVGENLFTAKQAGYDETYLPWMEIKDFLNTTYVSMLNYLDSVGKNDIKIIFQLVNDEVYIGGYNDRLDFTPLFVISNIGIPEGMVVIDIMEN